MARLAVSDARAKVGELVGAVRTLPNSTLLMRPFQKREAVLSSRIEGTRTTLEEAFAGDATELVDEDGAEVRNYGNALEHGWSALSRGQPLSRFLIREMHEVLLRGVRGEESDPGRFRDVQVWLGSPGQSSPRGARFVPPPPEYVPDGMEALEAWLGRLGHEDPLVRVAMAHYQFETIHPFRDGNGRVGRLLIALQLVHEGLMPEPWLYVSPELERLRDDYYALLFQVSSRGDFTGWVEFFAGCVHRSAQQTIQRIDLLEQLKARYRNLLQGQRSLKPTLLMETLFAAPFLTVEQAARRLDCSRGAADKAVRCLVSAGILERVAMVETGGRGRPADAFGCRELVRVLEVG